MKNDYMANKEKLADRIKNKPANLPIQQVNPVKQKNTDAEAHVNFWISNELMRRLKRYAADNDLTIKEIGIQAFNQFLDKSI